jgi:hypothetical protein
MRVGHQAQHAHRARDAGFVDALEAPSRHAGGGAVAERLRDAELERQILDLAQWIRRPHQQSGEVDVVARRDADLAEQVTPVGRQIGEQSVPRLRERGLRGLGQDCRLGRRDELERPSDAFGVDSPQHSSNRFGSHTAPAARHVEANRRPGAARSRRCEEC